MGSFRVAAVNVLGAVILVAPVAGFSASAAAAPPAGSPAKSGYCYNPGFNNPDPGSGTVRGNDVKAHSGPYAACSTLFTVDYGQKLYWHCAYINAYNNVWIHVRLTTKYQGWIYRGDLQDKNHNYPSVIYCS